MFDVFRLIYWMQPGPTPLNNKTMWPHREIYHQNHLILTLADYTKHGGDSSWKFKKSDDTRAAAALDLEPTIDEASQLQQLGVFVASRSEAVKGQQRRELRARHGAQRCLGGRELEITSCES